MVRSGGEAVDGGLGEEGVGGHGEPFGGFAVGDPDGALSAVAFDDEFVEVTGLGRVERFESEVVEDQQVDGGDAAYFGVEGVSRRAARSRVKSLSARE